MNKIDWTELKQIFAEACELRPDERSALLERRCAGRPGLRAEVEEYLRHHVELTRRPALPSPALRGELAGAQIDRYRLIERIGEGGFGTVWLAEQEEPLKRLVALKLLRPGMDSKTVLARFDVERQALALMDHPGIARILDGGATEEGRPYFVMELVRGQPITEFCDQRALSTAKRLALFREVCLAVQHAHQKGVIHRDLKPSNVLVTDQDGRPQAKVIDFGVAKATGPSITQQTLATGIDQMIGTPDYMAPEQAAPGTLDIDTRADVYALGVLLYELLTGTRPFDMRKLLEKGLEQVLRTLREVEPERPSLRLATLGGNRASVALQRSTTPERLHAALARDLDWLVLRALEKERSRRYSTVQDFADDVSRFLRHEPLIASPPSATYMLRKFARRNRLAVGAATVVALALVAGTAAAWRGYVVAEQRRVLAEERRVVVERKTIEADEQRAEAIKRGVEADEQRKAAMLAAEREKSQREIAASKAAEAQRELERSAYFIEILYELLGGTEADELQHPNMRVSDLLENFERDLGPRLASQPGFDAGVHLVLAHAWLGLGNEQRSNACLDLARAELARHPSEPLISRYVELESRRLGPDGDWSAPIELLREAIRARGPAHTPRSSRLASYQQLFLADLLRNGGQRGESEDILRSLLAQLETSEPRELDAEQWARSSLAKTLIKDERPAEAEEVLRSMFVADPGSAAVRLNDRVNLGSVVLSQGRGAEAETLLRDAAAAVSAELGGRHPLHLSVLLDLGSALLVQDKFAEAEKVLRQALDFARATYPARSQALARPLSQLGAALQLQERSEAALPFSLEALAIARVTKPGKDPELARLEGEVGGELLCLARYEEALPYCIEDLEFRRAEVPTDLEYFDCSLLAMAEVLRGLQRFAEAESLLRERMQLYPAAQEDSLLRRGHALSGLGETLVGLQRWPDAETCLRESLVCFEALGLAGAWPVENAHSLLGVALIGQDRISEGEELLRRSAQLMQTTPPPPAVGRAVLERLVRHLEATGQTQEAAERRAELERPR